MRENNKGITKAILRIVATDSWSTMHSIMNRLADFDIHPDERTLKTLISQLKRRGLLMYFERTTCECCGRIKKEIGITEQGLLKLNSHVTRKEAMAIIDATDKYLKAQQICNI